MWQDVASTSDVIDIKKSKDPIEGTFIGRKEITTKIGAQVIWEFSGEEGEFGIYGFTNLNKIMETVPLNTSLRIQYTGTKNVQTKYGMKNVHQVKVQRWSADNKTETSVDDIGF